MIDSATNDWFSWFWKIFVTTLVGAAFSAATVFAISFFNNVNTNIVNVATSLSLVQNDLGGVKGELKGYALTVDGMRNFITKINDNGKADSKEQTKLLQELKEKCLLLEERVKTLEATKKESKP